MKIIAVLPLFIKQKQVQVIACSCFLFGTGSEAVPGMCLSRPKSCTCTPPRNHVPGASCNRQHLQRHVLDCRESSFEERHIIDKNILQKVITLTIGGFYLSCFVTLIRLMVRQLWQHIVKAE